MGFTSILVIGNRAAVLAQKCHSRGKGKGSAKVTAVSTEADAKVHMPMKLPSSKQVYIKTMAVGLEVTNVILPSPMCADSRLHLLAPLAIFKAMLDSDSVEPKDKEQATGIPIVMALHDAILYSEGDRCKGLRWTILFEIIFGLSCRVPLTMLVKLDGDIHPYLTVLMVATLAQVAESLVVP